jgi:integrase
MATVYRQQYTQLLPRNVQIVERNGQNMAMWPDRRGRQRYDRITTSRNGQVKILRYSPTYVARYRDENGVTRTVSTGCRDEQAARHVLADILKRVEHRKAGILTGAEDRQAGHAGRSLSTHVSDYVEHMKAKTVRGRKVSAAHRQNVQRCLSRLLVDCEFHLLADITRGAMEKWMNRQEDAGMSARTRNVHRSAILAFCNWCVETDRMANNPLARLCRADERSDTRHARRALTEEEVARLLRAAILRPVAEVGRLTIHRPKEECRGRRTWSKQPLAYENLEAAHQRGLQRLANRPEVTAELQFQGRQRALMYRILLTTGLRRGELLSLTIGQLALDDPQPYAELLARDEKAGRGAMIPLRADVVAEIRGYLADLQRRDGCKLLPLGEKLFEVTPGSVTGMFDRDRAAAGIAKRDERGRVVDVHALRHTFGTHLAKAGVAPRVAMAAMRHSTIALTMNVYTDPALLDVGAAVDSLPAFAVADPSATAARLA